MPPVPTADLERVSRRLRRQFPTEVLPLPAEPEVVQLETPVPRLTLVAADTGGGYRIPGAALTFAYGPVEVEPDYPGSGQQDRDGFQHSDGRIYQVTRDWSQEHAFAAELEALGLVLYGEVGGWPRLWLLAAANSSAMLQGWRALEQHTFPALQDQGWEISRRRRLRHSPRAGAG